MDEVQVREVNEDDYESIVELLKSFFPAHNRFTQSDENIFSYLQALNIMKGYQNIMGTPFFMMEKGGEAIAFCALVHKDGTADGSHRVFKYKHLAFTSDEIGVAFVQALESKISKLCDSAKVELTIAQSEKSIPFYESAGFKKEAELSNHYRMGETCFIFGKTITGE